eukprot:scaffold20880_cov174-Amphora_coffeaeformis.AAC.6
MKDPALPPRDGSSPWHPKDLPLFHIYTDTSVLRRREMINGEEGSILYLPCTRQTTNNNNKNNAIMNQSASRFVVRLKTTTARAAAVSCASVIMTAAAAAAAAVVSYSVCEEEPAKQPPQQSPNQSNLPTTTKTTAVDPATAPPVDPSWMRRTLYRLGLVSRLPLPRRVRANPKGSSTDIDPAIVVSSRLLRQRAKDEQQLPRYQQALAHAVQRGDHETAQGLVLAVYDTLYGGGMTPQRRTEFLMRYGCTAWNDNILQTLVNLAEGRGLVEIGAGHGQWARALQDYRNQQYRMQQQQAQQTQQKPPPLPHPQSLVRAYDDGSQLPLNPNVYRKGTVPYEQYFGTVFPCPDIASVLAQFENRHRILLLVYPPPDSDMAVNALQAYTALYEHHPDDDDSNHHPDPMLIYVGEGRGGANANEAFFQALATIDNVTTTANKDGRTTTTHSYYAWYLIQILDGVPCGTKGEEKVYIFQRRRVVDR